MGKVRHIITAAAVVVILLGGMATALAQTPEEPWWYCPETGHVVRGDFLAFFNSRGGLEIFGYPLTEAFIENGRRVQYFQRARMEFHPENLEPYRVQLGLLGELLGHRIPPIPRSRILLNHPDCQYFPETGHTACYAFLFYYRSHGGLDIFGYPISEFLIENGRIVQYFQRARMEWHPEKPSGQKVQLGNLGEIYVERFGVPYEFLKPVEAPRPDLATPQPTPQPQVTSLHASASVQYAITGRGGHQTVFVYVTDQQRRPVEGAAVGIVVHYPSADHAYTLRPTNQSGFARFTFELGSPTPGKRVVIDVNVNHNGLSTTTQTFFLPWW